jgi:predicted RNA-binding Zn ribbon-like protein
MDVDAAALLVGFLNTVHLPDGVDALETSTAADWRADGLADDGRSLHPRPTTIVSRAASETETLRVLRAAFRALLRPRADWTAEQREAVEQAGEELRQNPFVVRLPSRPGLPQLVLASEGWTGIDVAVLVTAYFTACADGGIERIKTCARSECQWAFLDASRNSSRRWCAMAQCGNVVKNRRYRARRSATIKTGHRRSSRSKT